MKDVDFIGTPQSERSLLAIRAFFAATSPKKPSSRAFCGGLMRKARGIRKKCLAFSLDLGGVF